MKTPSIGLEEVVRYKSLPLLERLRDRGDLMKRVPMGVVVTLEEAEAEVERLQAALDEVQTVLQTTSQSGMWRVLKAMAILEAAESAGDPPCKP